MLYPCHTLYKTVVETATATTTLIHEAEESKNFKRMYNSGFRHSHMPKTLWCYIHVTPSTRLYLRLPLPHRHWFMEQKNESKNFKRRSISGFRHSHLPKALWCYIPVTPSTRLYLRLPLPHRHWFMEQKNESKNFKKVYIRVQTQPHA